MHLGDRVASTTVENLVLPDSTVADATRFIYYDCSRALKDTAKIILSLRDQKSYKPSVVVVTTPLPIATQPQFTFAFCLFVKPSPLHLFTPSPLHPHIDIYPQASFGKLSLLNVNFDTAD